MNKRKIRKFLKIAALGIVILILLFSGFIWIFKKKLVESALSKVQDKLKVDYGATFNYKGLKISGLADIYFENLEIKVGENQIFESEQFFISPSLLKIIIGDLKIADLQINKIEINLNNLKYLKKKKQVSTPSKGLFAKLSRYSKLLETIINALPESVNIHEGILFYSDSMDVVQAKLEKFKIGNTEVTGEIALVVNGKKSNWNITGELINGFANSKFALTAPAPQFVAIDKIESKFKTVFGFSKIEFGIQEILNTEEDIHIKFYGGANELHIINEKISKDTVIIHDMSGLIDLYVDKNEVILNPTSTFSLNEIKSNVGIKYHYKDSIYISVDSKIDKMKAQSFLNSLPVATFDKLKTMQLDGGLSYKLKFFLNYPRMDSVFVDSDLEGYGLKILNEGEVGLSKINQSFEYQPFNSKRIINVGFKNPNYTPIDEISQDLQDAITESEDGDFYNSNGFNEPAFGKSIVENIKAKSFKRGGSTIPMQLVKNVFLSHKKTIDRKLEEMILNWMIQNLKIVSKRRQLEVYLNIIEWGPNIYGVGEATKYYFAKHPSEITLQEALFMAMIIPSPKKYRYYFDETGHLRNDVKWHFRKIGYLMNYRGKISREEWENLRALTDKDTIPLSVQLMGRSKMGIKINSDSVLDSDSLKRDPTTKFEALMEE